VLSSSIAIFSIASSVLLRSVMISELVRLSVWIAPRRDSDPVSARES